MQPLPLVPRSEAAHIPAHPSSAAQFANRDNSNQNDPAPGCESAALKNAAFLTTTAIKKSAADFLGTTLIPYRSRMSSRLYTPQD